MESINSENSQTSSADSESEDESESGYSLIAGIGSILLEKKIESEAALMYSQQMETLVGGYEVFIKEMKELSEPTESKPVRNASSAITSKNSIRGMVSDETRLVVEAENETLIGIEKPMISSSDAAASRARLSEELEESFDTTDGTQKNVIQSSSLFDTSRLSRTHSKRSSCNCKVAKVDKKVNAMCRFMQKLFNHQIQIIGKCYQDQMESRRRTEELKASIEDYDDEFVFWEQQVLSLKKSNQKLHAGLSSVMTEQSDSLKEWKVTIKKMGEHIEKLAELQSMAAENFEELMKNKHSKPIPKSSSKNQESVTPERFSSSENDEEVPDKHLD